MELVLANLRNEVDPIQLQNLCRMCAVKVDKAIPIFGEEGVQHELANKIMTHLPIKLSESDSLPHQLCYECTSLLIQWDAALVGSLAADRKLRALQWKQQQAGQTREIKETREEKSSNAASESLSCSVCNQSGMDFRELILHLKNHEPLVTPEKDKSVNNINEHDGDSEMCSGLPESNPSLGSAIKIKGRKDKDDSGSLLGNNTMETLQNGDDSVKSRLRKRKLKSTLDDPKDNGPEIGSGDPQVTSSTGTPPFKAAEVPTVADSSPTNTSLKAINVCSYNGKENDLTKAPNNAGVSPQKAEQHLQDGLSKPKVRIISAENINLSLEQRAKANMSAKSTESNPVKNTPPAASSVSVLASSDKSLGSPFLNKNKIVISSEVMKQIGSVRGKPGPKLLRLKDGRIVRLLDNAATVSSLSNAFQRIYRPIQPAPSLDMPLPTKVQARSVLIKTPAPVLPTISRVVTVQDKVSSDSSSVPPINKGNVTIPLPVPTTKPDETPVRIKTEPAEENPSLLPAVNQRRMVNISFHPQPGPKNSVPRFTCYQCGKRNLFHDSLHTHAQMHAPDKAVLNAVSVPRSFSPVVASSIIRVVSGELRNQNPTPPIPGMGEKTAEETGLDKVKT